MFSLIRFLTCTLLILGISFQSVVSYAEENRLELKDLDFSLDAVKADPGRQELLNQRTHKLKTHEILGPITWGLMTATLLTAPDHQRASTLHQTLGGVTGAMYFTTAYFAWTAPNDSQAGKTKGNLKIHKILQWVTLPLMVLTPIAGMLAQRQLGKGQEPHGLAGLKGGLATSLYIAYSASFAVMVFDF